MSATLVFDICTADTWCFFCDEHMNKHKFIFGGFSIGQTPYRELLFSEWVYEKVQLSKAESICQTKICKVWVRTGSSPVCWGKYTAYILKKAIQ